MPAAYSVKKQLLNCLELILLAFWFLIGLNTAQSCTLCLEINQEKGQHFKAELCLEIKHKPGSRYFGNILKGFIELIQRIID